MDGPLADATARREFTIARVFDAPRERVWQAWTDPDQAPAWFHPLDYATPRDRVEFDVRPGGRYRYVMVATDGREFATGGEYREVDPPRRLVMTWGEPGEPDGTVSVVTVELAEHGPDGAQTHMTFHLAGFAGRPGDGYVYDGWSEAFDLLEAAVAG